MTDTPKTDAPKPIAPTQMVHPAKPATTSSKAPVKPATKAVPTTGNYKAEGEVVKPVAPPPFRIRSKQERQESKYLKILIYADFGVGKTWLAGTAADVPKMNDVLCVSAESGELTWDSDTTGKFDNIDTIDAKDYKTVAKTFDFLKLHCQLRDEGTPESLDKLKRLQAKFTGQSVEEIETPRKYNTVIIDSLTEVEAYCMMQLLNISDKLGLDQESQTAEWAEYKKQHTMVQRLVRAYRDLPMHVIFVCARAYVQDDQKRMLFSPQMTGKLSSQIQGFMDIVGYLTTYAKDNGDLGRKMFVQPTGKFAAKNRLSSYRKPSFDDPTMASILKEVGMLK